MFKIVVTRLYLKPLAHQFLLPVFAFKDQEKPVKTTGPDGVFEPAPSECRLEALTFSVEKRLCYTSRFQILFHVSAPLLQFITIQPLNPSPYQGTCGGREDTVGGGSPIRFVARLLTWG